MGTDAHLSLESDGFSDSLFPAALRLASLTEDGPVSFLQRKLKVGFKRGVALHQAVRNTVLTMALQNAWAELASAYWRGEVNSECTMQACLYAALKRKLPGFYVLCEPELPKKLAPDLVVCYRNEIVAFVELKFTKAKRTKCLEDLDKLKQLLDGGPYDGLRIDPRTGCFENDAFVVAKDCLAVFGKIEDTKFLNEKSFRAYWGEVDSTRFLPLIESLKRTEVVDHQAGISRGFHAS